MMEIQKDFSLRALNTFGVEALARYYVSVHSIDALREVLSLEEYPLKFILGGGSNLLITAPIEALVIHMNITGIITIWEDDDTVTLKVMAGENWHSFVLWTLEHGYGGLENLSLIPGQVGTAPIQNIGAYGVELKDVFVSCDAMSVDTGKLRTFSKADCNFGYRDSYFKQEGKGKFVITSVILQLTKKNHGIHTEYGAIKTELQERGIKDPGIKDVSDAVIAIRSSKLPDPATLGNSGSFFKNPVISEADFSKLKTQYPEIPGYPQEQGSVKVPAGWLIEQCGFKGKREGDAGVYEKQALVLVNHGKATGEGLLALARQVQSTVFDRFEIHIEPEVNIIP